MMRHLFILARDRAALGAPLAIALDRHLARGEQIDIMLDRRSTDSTRAPQWPTGRERRRSGLAEQLAVQGYAICSRQEDHPPMAGATAPRRDPAAAPGRGPMERGPMAPPPPPPRPFAGGPRPFTEGPRSIYDERRPEIDEMRAARAEAELAREAAFRGRMGGRRLSEPLTDDEDWSPTGEDPYGEEPPRRRGFFAGLTSAFAAALVLAVAGAFLFAPQIRDFVTVLTEPRRATVESTGDRSRTLTASEETTGRSPAPAAPSSSAPAPTSTPATPAPPVPPTAAQLREVAQEPAAMPPRQSAQEPAAAPPRQSAQEPAALPSRQSAREPAAAPPRQSAQEPAALPPRQSAQEPAALPPRQSAQEPAALPPRQSAQQPTRSAIASRDTGARREAPPAEPTPARDTALPPRETEAAREASPPSLPPRRAELTSASGMRTERLPDFPGLPRVDVTRAPGQDGTTFTVRLTDQRGTPMSGAQVTLRQKSTDGYVRETTLEPIAPAGSYRGAVPTTSGRQSLTVRVVLGDRRVEMPVSE